MAKSFRMSYIYLHVQNPPFSSVLCRWILSSTWSSLDLGEEKKRENLVFVLEFVYVLRIRALSKSCRARFHTLKLLSRHWSIVRLDSISVQDHDIHTQEVRELDSSMFNQPGIPYYNVYLNLSTFDILLSKIVSTVRSIQRYTARIPNRPVSIFIPDTSYLSRWAIRPQDVISTSQFIQIPWILFKPIDSKSLFKYTISHRSS